MAFGSRPGHTRGTYDQGIPPRIAEGIVFRGIPVNYGTFCGMGNAVCQQFLKENTKIYQKLRQSANRKSERTRKSRLSKKRKKSTGLLEEYGIRLPKSIEEKLFGNVEKGADSVLETSGVYKAMAEPLAQLAVDGIAFFVSLIVCAIILHLIGGVLDIASELPVIKGINQVLGLGAGLLYGLLLVWLFFYFVAVMQSISVWTESVGDDTAE